MNNFGPLISILSQVDQEQSTLMMSNGSERAYCLRLFGNSVGAESYRSLLLLQNAKVLFLFSRKSNFCDNICSRYVPYGTWCKWTKTSNSSRFPALPRRLPLRVRRFFASLNRMLIKWKNRRISRSKSNHPNCKKLYFVKLYFVLKYIDIYASICRNWYD